MISPCGVVGGRWSSAVAILGVTDPDFLALLAPRTTFLVESDVPACVPLVFLATDSPAELAALPELAR